MTSKPRWMWAKRSDPANAFPAQEPDLILDQPSPLGRSFIYLCFLMVLTILMVVTVFDVQKLSTSAGRLIPSDKTVSLFIPEQMNISRVLVNEGQRVSKGQTLLIFDSSALKYELAEADEKISLQEAEIERLQTELSGLFLTGKGSHGLELDPRLLAMRIGRHGLRVKEAEEEYRQRIFSAKGTVAELAKLEAGVTIVQKREEELRPHIGDLISQDDYLKVKQELISGLGNIFVARERLSELKAATMEAANKLQEIGDELKIESGLLLKERLSNLASLKAGRNKTFRSLGFTNLVSPIDGEVLAIESKVSGMPIFPNQSVIVLVPNSEPIGAEAIVNSEDVASIKLGQEVEVRVDSFPFQKHGTLRGNVSLIGADAQISDDTRGREVKRSNSENAGGTFLVKISIKSNQLGTDIPVRELRPGTNVQVDFLGERSKLYELIYSPIQKMSRQARNLH